MAKKRMPAYRHVRNCWSIVWPNINIFQRNQVYPGLQKFLLNFSKKVDFFWKKAAKNFRRWKSSYGPNIACLPIFGHTFLAIFGPNVQTIDIIVGALQTIIVRLVMRNPGYALMMLIFRRKLRYDQFNFDIWPSYWLNKNQVHMLVFGHTFYDHKSVILI